MLKIQYDEREVTETKAEILVIPSGSPYKLRLEEVPSQDGGVEIRRISPTVKMGAGGSGSCESGGIYTGLATKNYKIEIDFAGEIGVATFKWSNDGGATWQDEEILIANTDPIGLELGLTAAFAGGDGTDFVVGDYWLFSAEFWTEVDYIPTQTKEYQVNYVNGDVLFHSADADKEIQVSYEGRGSLVDAEDINRIIDVLSSGEIALRGVDTDGLSLNKAVYVVDDDSFGLASAEDDTKPSIGFVTVSDDEIEEIQVFGPLDGFTGLTKGTRYYLSTVDGEVTDTPPSGAGNIVQLVGIGMSTTKLLYCPLVSFHFMLTCLMGNIILILQMKLMKILRITLRKRRKSMGLALLMWSPLKVRQVRSLITQI